MALTKLNNKAVANITTLPVSLGDMVLVSSATASSSAYIEFTLGNYKEYQFYFVDIHPSGNNVDLAMNFSIDSGSNYNVSKITTFAQAYHNEAGTDTALEYNASHDMVGTGFAIIAKGMGNDNDQTIAGSMKLFNPSSSVFVKHFIISNSNYSHNDYHNNFLIAGYANTSSILTNIRFQMASGNIDSGTILMYGLN